MTLQSGTNWDAKFASAISQLTTNGGGVLYVPTGDYTLNNALILPDHTLLMGDGTNATILRWTTPQITAGSTWVTNVDTRTVVNGKSVWTGAAISVEDIQIVSPSDYNPCVGIKDCSQPTFFRRVVMIAPNVLRASDNDPNRGHPWGYAVNPGFWASSSANVEISDCYINAIHPIDMDGSRSVLGQRNTLIWRGAHSFVNGAMQGLSFESNAFIFKGTLGVDSWDSPGWEPRFYCTARLVFAQREMFWIGNTTTSQISQYPGIVGVIGHDTSAASTYIGPIVSADPVTGAVTLPVASVGYFGAGRIASVIAGRGAGQIRHGRSNVVGGVFSVDRPWDVTPDSTSIIAMRNVQGRMMWIGNDFQFDQHVSNYYTSHDFILANNKLGGPTSGFGYILYSGVNPADSGGRFQGTSMALHHQFLDNQIQKGGFGCSFNGNNTSNIANYNGANLRAVVWRNTSLLDGSGYKLGIPMLGCDGLVVENNQKMNSLSMASGPTWALSCPGVVRKNTNTTNQPISIDVSTAFELGAQFSLEAPVNVYRGVTNSGPIPQVSTVDMLLTGTSNFWAALDMAVPNLLSGTGSLWLKGPCALTLSASNSYTGATLVSGGTLNLNGSVGSGAVTVSGSGVLAGTGTTGGPVTIASGGTLSPGAGGSGMKVGGDLVVKSGATMTFTIGTASSKVIVPGNLTLSGQLNILDGGGILSGTTYTLFTYTGQLYDAFISLGTLPIGHQYVLDTSVAGTVRLWVDPPPPTAPTLTATAFNGSVRLSWTAVPGAGSYTIKRSLASGSNYLQVASDVTSLQYNDVGLTNGTTYYHVVTAVNGAGSTDSVETSATPSGAQPAPSSWNVDASGIWTSAANWTCMPTSAAGDLARLTCNITANRTVTIADDVSLRGLMIGDSNNTHSYTLALSAGSLVWDNAGAGVSISQISTSKGDTIAAPSILQDRLTLTNSSSNLLTISGPISVNQANTSLTFAGTGKTALLGGLVFNGLSGTSFTINAPSATSGTINGITFGDDTAAMTILGSAISLTGNVTNNSSNAQTITNALSGNFSPTGAGAIILTGSNAGLTGDFYSNGATIGIGSNTALGSLRLRHSSADETFFASGGARTISNQITWNSTGYGLNVSGSYPLTFTGPFYATNNTRVASITIDNTALTTLSGTLSILNGSATGSLAIDGAGDLLISGPILNGGTNSGGVAYSGSGTLTISGSNSYSGPTVVNSGVLIVSNTAGSALGSGSVSIAAGATLGGNGFISGPVTLSGSGILEPGLSGTSGMLELTSLALNDGCVMNLQLNGTDSWDNVAVSGSVTCSGTTTINVTVLPGFISGSYVLMTAAAGIDIAHFALGNLPAGSVSSLTATGDTLYLTIWVPPAAPTGFTATNTSAETAQVSLVWDPSIDEDAYVLKRGTVSGGPYAVLATGTDTTYLDTTVSSGVTYYYVVSGTNIAGLGANSSESSAIAWLRPLITSPSSAKGVVGSAFSYQIAAINTPTGFSATGLPNGLSCDPATGLISGTPLAVGTASATITASNAGGTISTPLTLRVFASAAAVWNVNASGNWSTASNWTRLPNSVADLARLTYNITANRTVTVDQAFTVGGLEIGDSNGSGSYTLSLGAGSLTLDNDGAGASITQLSTSAGDTVTANLLLADALSVSNNAGNLLTLSGALTVNKANVSLTQTGSGVVALLGGLVFNANSGNSFRLIGTSTTSMTVGPLTFSAGSLAMTVSGSPLTLAGPSTTVTASADATISAALGGASITKSGTAKLTLSGNLVYTGTTMLDQGTLAIVGGRTLAGGLLFGLSATTTNVSALDLSSGSISFGGAILVQTNSAIANTIAIGSGQALASTGNVTVGANGGTTAGYNPVSKLTVGGLGAWNCLVNNGSFRVGNSSTAGGVSQRSAAATLDMNGLASFAADLRTTGNSSSGGTFTVGDAAGGATGSGETAFLAVNSTITANALTLQSGGATGVNTLKFGNGAQVLNINTITVGNDSRGDNVLTFGTNTGTLQVRATNGTGGATWNIGNQAISNSSARSAMVTLSGHQADLLLSALNVANLSSSGANANVTGSFSFDSGTLTGTTVTIGKKASAAAGANTYTGTLILGGTGNLLNSSTIVTLDIANQQSTAGTIAGSVNIAGNATSVALTNVTVASSSATGGTANGTLSIAGGTVTVANGITLASRSGTPGVLSGSLSITGGSLQLGGDLSTVGSGGTMATGLTLNGGYLNLGGHAIGGAGQLITNLSFQSGTLSDVSQINNGMGLAKTGTGTLTVGGSNGFSGGASVNGGVLLVSNTNGSALGSGTVGVASGATLGGSGFVSGTVTVAAGGILAPGLSGTTGALTLGGLILSGSCVMNVELRATGSSDSVNLTGAFSASGTTTVNVTTLAGFTGGTYPLITGAPGINASRFALGSTPVGSVCSLSVSGSTLFLTAWAPVTAPDTLAAAQVSGIGAQVSLAWSPVIGAVTYDVKRSTTSGGPYTPIGSVSGTNFADLGMPSGVPYYYVVSGSNPAGSGANSFEASVMVWPLPSITSALTATGTNGSEFAYQIIANNNTTAFATTNPPDGLALDSASGLISGTPSITGTFGVTLSATNAAGIGSALLTLTILPTPPSITGTLTASGTQGSAFSYQISATNTPTAYGATSLPAGLSVDGNTGLVSGTPTISCTSTVTISAANAGGSGTALLTLIVLPAPPVIGGTLHATGTNGFAFSYQIAASNSPTSYGATNLPPGLNVSSSTGIISGTPEANGTTSVTISASNDGGTGRANLEIVILPTSAAVWNVDADGVWSNPGNWTRLPGGVDDIAWLTYDISANRTVTIDQAVSLSRLDTGDPNGSNSFTLASGTGTLTFDNHGAGATIKQLATSKGDTISSNLSLTDNLSVTNLSTNPLTLSGTVTVNKSNATLAQSGSGSLALSVGLSFNATSGAGFAFVGTSASTTAVGAMTFSTGAATMTLSGSPFSLAGTAPAITTNANAIISAPIAGTGLLKTGSAVLALTGSLSYSGTTTISQGTLQIASTSPATLAGALVFGGSAAGTTTGVLDLTNAGATFGGGLMARTNSAVANTIAIGSGRTLATNANVAIGLTNTTGAAFTTALSVTGAGAWVVSSSNGQVQIGAGTSSTRGVAGTLNLGGLNSYSADLRSTGTSGGAFIIGSIGTSSQVSGGNTTLISATNTTIKAATLRIGSTSGASELDSLSLGGGVQIFNANAITLGAGPRDNASVAFATSSGSLVIRAADGAGRASLSMGGLAATGNFVTQTFDVTGHSADLLLGAVKVLDETANSVGGGSASFKFDEGSLDASNFLIGSKSAGSHNANPWSGAVSIGSAGNNTASATLGAVTMASLTTTSTSMGSGLISGTLNIAGANTTVGMTSLKIANYTTGTSSGNAAGVVNITDGTTSVTNGINLANAVAGSGTASATLNLTGGSLSVGTAGVSATNGIFTTVSGGTVTTTLTLDGASLNLNGNAIGGAGQLITNLNFLSGTLRNVSQINNGAGLTKSGSGRLTLSGSNSYTGDTTVNAGTLSLAAATLADSSIVRIAAGAVLNLTHSGTDVVTVLILNDVYLPSGIYTAANTSGYITGTGAIQVINSLELWAAYQGLDGTPGKENGANDDPDHDGWTNAQEYAAGTDPLNRASVLKVKAMSRTGDDMTVTFSTVAGRTYRLERSDTLQSDSWTTVQGGIVGNGGDLIVIDPAAASQPRRFYRIVILQ